MMQVFIANIFYLSFFGGDFFRVCIYLVCLYLLWWEVDALVVPVWCAWCNVVLILLFVVFCYCFVH